MEWLIAPGLTFVLFILPLSLFYRCPHTHVIPVRLPWSGENVGKWANIVLVTKGLAMLKAFAFTLFLVACGQVRYPGHE